MKRTAVALLALLIPIAALAQEPEQAQEPELEQGWVEVARLLAEVEAYSRQWLQTQLAASAQEPELAAVDRFFREPAGQQGLAAVQQLRLMHLSEPTQEESERFFRGLVSRVLERSRIIEEMFSGARLSGFSVSAFPPAVDVHFEFNEDEDDTQ